MAAELLTHSTIGAAMGSPANTGAGLVFGMYGVTCTENGDWVVLSDFDTIYGCAAYAVSSDVHTPEAVEVDTSVTNKIFLSAGGTDVMVLWVWGTPANTD